MRTGKGVVRGAAGLAAAALLLTGCGGDSDSGDSGDSDNGKKPAAKGGKPTEGSAPAQSEAPKEKLPSAYDAAKGWAVEESEGLTDPVYAPHAKAVLFLRTGKGGASTQVVARDLRTGAVRWTGAPVELPSSGQESMVDGETKLLVTSKGNTDYALVTFSGEAGGDGATKSKELTRFTVFPANGSGTVKAARTIEFPYLSDLFTAQDTDGIVHNVARLEENEEAPVSVDVTTGKKTIYKKSQLVAPPKAKGCREEGLFGGECDENAGLFGVTPEGPLVNDGDTAFWQGAGSWYSGNNPPSDADSHLGDDVIADYLGGSVIARWKVTGGGSPKRMEVRDPKTGEVRASVRCVEQVDAAEEPPVVLSGGRYVTAGAIVMDLKQNKGYCFEDTDDRKEVTFTAADATHGTAYGTVPGEKVGSDAIPVEVDLAADKVTPLDPETRLPSWTAEGVAAYTPDAESTTWTDGVTAAFYPSK